MRPTLSLVLPVFAILYMIAVAAFGEESANKKPLSIVVLGDSVASGEGINYGYKYYYNAFWPSGWWYGGVVNPKWEPPNQLCHDSKQAYGDLIAQALGAKLAKFACTGSTFENGLTGPRHVGAQHYRRAQFGNWTTQKHLNPAYDAAAPDVVIVTFGADDVNFVDIVTFCATGYTKTELETLSSEIETEGFSDVLRKNLVAMNGSHEKLQARIKARVETKGWFNYCTAANPGKPIQQLFWTPINNGTIAKHYREMVAMIQARGKAHGKVPHIIFTTYHSPLPLPSASISDCHDLLTLDRAEVNYLLSLEARLDQEIKNTLGPLPGVTVADISTSMNGHRWCSPDPWVYGLSILVRENSASQAPFHPTPAGQKAIARLILPHVRSLTK